LDSYAAHVIETSPTHSATTAHNEFMRVLRFVNSRGVPLRKKNDVLVCEKDAPKIVKNKKVVVNSDEDVRKFLSHCRGQKQWAMFLTLQRSGLRKMELATLRWRDVTLNGVQPNLDVCERTVGGPLYIPKWYAERRVTIDPMLVDALRKLKPTSAKPDDLVFGRKGNKIDWHIHRTTKQITTRAGFDEKDWRPHRFRANFATHCLRNGMDLETLRSQLGHKDTESLRKYITAMDGEQRAGKVAQVMATAAA
jgi:integrase